MSTELSFKALEHHALLLRGERTLVVHKLEQTLSIAFSTTADPDILYTAYESLGIDEVRALAQSANRLPIEREVMRLIVAVDAITLEAQNALLKLTEDPPLYARFVFILPTSFPVIPTFRSRFEEIVFSHRSDAEDMFEGSLGVQLERVAKMAKDGNSAAMEDLLVQAEHEVQKGVRAQHAKSGLARAVMTARRYIEARGAAPKMLLEHVLISRAASKDRV